MSPCLGCGRCCFETEMMLTNEDVARLVAQGHHDFHREEDGYLILRWTRREDMSRCVFQTGNSHDVSCSVYEARPAGCRFYPVIWIIDEGRCAIDLDCPHGKAFRHDLREISSNPTELRELIQTILREREERIENVPRSGFNK